MEMSESHLVIGREFQLPPGCLSGWNAGCLEPPIPETIASVRTPEKGAINQFTALDEERYPQQLLGLNWVYSADQQQRRTRELGRVANNVITSEQGAQLNGHYLDWPNSDYLRDGSREAWPLEPLVDNSYARHRNRSVDRSINLDKTEFLAQNASTYASATNGNLDYPHSLCISDSQEKEIERLATTGNSYGGINTDLAENKIGSEGLPEAAIDGGPSTCKNVSQEFSRDLQEFIHLVEQTNLDLSASIAYSLSQSHPSSCHAEFSPHNPPLNRSIPEADAVFPERYTFMSPVLLPTSGPSLVDPEYLPPNSDANNQYFLPDSSTPTGGSETLQSPFDLDATFHPTRSVSIPSDFGLPSPHYSGYTMCCPAFRKDSCESALKPPSPPSSIVEMDHHILATPKTSYSSSISPPSTADLSSPKKRSSLSAKIKLPPTIKEFNYDSSTLITKKSRGRKPLTRPSTITSPQDTYFENTLLNPGSRVQFLGQHWNVISDPELLSSMETAKTSSLPKVFVCEVDGCRQCFRRCEHLRRHARTIHSAAKPFVCPWPGCSKTFNRNDNLKQHFQTHSRQSTPKH